MSPTNIALLKAYKAEKALREAQANLDNASRDVVAHESRIRHLTESLNLAQSRLREQQAHAGGLELEIKTIDAHIERLRQQQQMARTEKEYRAFVLEINSHKADKKKLEDSLLDAMAAVEQLEKEEATLKAQLESEKQRCEQTRLQLSAKLTALESAVAAARPVRDAAVQEIPRAAREMFERLCEKFDGEAMAAIGMPDRCVEEYICTACNMSLVVDVYNLLHVSDDPVACPSCRRLLYIPDDLPPPVAIGTTRQKKPAGRRKARAADPKRGTTAPPGNATPENPSEAAAS